MRYLTFSHPENTKYKIAILSPTLNEADMRKEYLDPFGVPRDEVVAFDLYKEGKKTPVAIMKEYLEDLVPRLIDIGVEYVVVTDADYFKVLSKQQKTEANLGYVLDCPYANFKLVYAPNYRAVFYDPDKVRAKIAQGMTALTTALSGSYTPPGDQVIKFAAYPKTYEQIKYWLQTLYDKNVPLTCDIEGFSLKHYDAGIGTISFAWSKHEGIAFPVDYGSEDGPRIRELLRAFFEEFRNKIIWHNISFDVYVLVYQLFMKDLEDTEGLLWGLTVMLKDWDDTKLIAYLATNTCAGNKLGLKDQAQEFAGNYAVEDIKDITKIPLDELLQYNLIDTLSTWYVYEKHYATMVADQQLDVYNTIFKPAIWDIIQMQLTGLPLDMDEVAKAKRIMQDDWDVANNTIQSLRITQAFRYELKVGWVKQKHAKWKQKRIAIADAPDQEFNPNSDKQLQGFLFDYLGLPVLDRTDSGQPATGKDTLKKLKNHTNDPEITALLSALVDLKDVDIILTTFITAFEKAVHGPSGQFYLFGNFNLGGTKSGRLSSNGPNLQNIPATGSKYAKIIKKCFRVMKGWLFVGLDFASLEDRISALTTKDPQKLKVYTDGYDGHCLRAYSYFEEYMTGIDPESVDSINSIAKIYGDFRQESKAPTFALTYQGTFATLMANCGFPEDKAKRIESRFKSLYVVSIEWVNQKLDQAAKDGYVTVAFGMRLRTPLLAQVIRGNKATPREAEAEGRTAGNALGQSWGLLNTRAVSAFMQRVRSSKYRLDIRPCAQIHDANYYIIRDDIEVLLWMNEHLVRETYWQDHPDIWHPDVKLGGNLDVFTPSWAEGMTLPEGAKESDLPDLLEAHYDKYKLH